MNGSHRARPDRATAAATAAALLMALALAMIFFYVPTDVSEGYSQRIFYFHVPIALTTYFLFTWGALNGARFLLKRDMSLDLTYTALASHKVDLIAGNSTDGRIASIDLFQLEDDRHYFPPYEAVFIIRRDVKDIAPSAGDAINPLMLVMNKLAGAISTDEMRTLNYQVDGARRDKKEVVHEWLIKKGFIQ